jgi:hypothetical protein
MAGTPTPNYTVRGVHINQALSSMSVGYHPQGMIAEQIFPVVPVQHESDDYYFWDKGQRFRVDRTDGKASLRADGARARQMNFGAVPKTYTCEEYAYETFITDRQRANADAALQLEITKTRAVQDLVLLDQELRIANLVMNPANNTNSVTLSGTSQWNNASFVSQPTSGPAFSNIKLALDTGMEAIRQATGGLDPNVIVITKPVARVMSRDIGLVDYVKYTHSDLLVAGLLPPNLWGMKVVIPGATYTNTVEGEAVTSFTDVYGKNVWLGYVAPQPGLDILTYGAIFRSREWQVKQWRDEAIDTTFYRPSFVQTEQLIAPDCGYLIQNAVA